MSREIITGEIAACSWDTQGDTLAVDVTTADTSITVADLGDFDEAGGVLLLGDDPAVGLVGYLAIPDDAVDVLELTGPAPVAAEAGDPVLVWNAVTDKVERSLQLWVLLDDAEDGDALPAAVTEGVESLLDPELNRNIGLHVELEVDDFGSLMVTSILGGRPDPVGAVKAKALDIMTVTGPGTQTLHLTYQPIPESEHLRWDGVSQDYDDFTRDGWTVTIPDPDGVLEIGDLLTMQYLYTDPTTEPLPVYSAPAWEARSGIWSSLPSSFITDVGLPAGTEVEDLLVVVAIGAADATVGDPRMTTVATDGVKTIALGYATDLSDLTCHVGGTPFALDQFAGVEILAVRGDGLFAHDPARIAVFNPVAIGGPIGSVAGAGHGVIAAVVAGYGSPITLDWATDMPAYDDWGGELATSVVGNFGYCATEPPPAQTNPANAAALVALIGLK